MQTFCVQEFSIFDKHSAETVEYTWYIWQFWKSKALGSGVNRAFPIFGENGRIAYQPTCSKMLKYIIGSSHETVTRRLSLKMTVPR